MKSKIDEGIVKNYLRVKGEYVNRRFGLDLPIGQVVRADRAGGPCKTMKPGTDYIVEISGTIDPVTNMCCIVAPNPKFGEYGTGAARFDIDPVDQVGERSIKFVFRCAIECEVSEFNYGVRIYVDPTVYPKWI